MFVESTDGCAVIRPQLGVYILGAIPPADRPAVVRHLAACSSCRDELAALAALPGLLIRPQAIAAALSPAPRDPHPARDPQPARDPHPARDLPARDPHPARDLPADRHHRRRHRPHRRRRLHPGSPSRHPGQLPLTGPWTVTSVWPR